jgi:site-specific DNA recombinase
LDQGYSGARLDRPGLDRLRDAVQDGAIALVVVLSPDRLARKYAYQVLLLEEWSRAGCQVIFLQHPISDDPNDQLLLQIQGAIAEYERAVAQERFRRGKLHRARAGQYLGSTPPYGYRYVPKRDGTPGHLVVDEREAELVRQVYRWLVDERLTGRQIVQRLNASGWRPRSGRRQWALCSVHKILTNPVYTGTAFANQTAVVPPEQREDRHHARRGRPNQTPGRRRRPPDEWIPIPVPALIPTVTADQAREQLARNATLSYRHAQHAYLLRCLLRCGTCGLAMTGDVRRATSRLPEYRYYHCSGKDCLASRREVPCPGPRVRAADVEQAVWSHVRQLLARPDLLLAQFRHFAHAATDGTATEQAETRRLTLRLERLRRTDQRLVDAYQAEVITLTELAERRRQLLEQRRALEAQRAQQLRLRHEHLAAQTVLGDLTGFCARICRRLDRATLADQQAILQLLIERIIVYADALEIHHVIPLRSPTADPAGPGQPIVELRSRGHVRVAQPEAQVPANGERDHLVGETVATESRS